MSSSSHLCMQKAPHFISVRFSQTTSKNRCWKNFSSVMNLLSVREGNTEPSGPVGQLSCEPVWRNGESVRLGSRAPQVRQGLSHSFNPPNRVVRTKQRERTTQATLFSSWNVGKCDKKANSDGRPLCIKESDAYRWKLTDQVFS